MIKFIKALYPNNKFYFAIAGIIAIFVFAFFYPLLLPLAQIGLIVLGMLSLIDIVALFLPTTKSTRQSNSSGKGFGRINAIRFLPERFSNGDQNPIDITISNQYPYTASIQIIDEIPFQFQKRDFELNLKLTPGASEITRYYLTPRERGIYSFGNLNLYAKSPIGLFSRRYRFGNKQNVPVYPGFLRMKQYEIMAISNRITEIGIKQIRKVGHTLEFDQIRQYNRGDDYRTINWKATARKSELMVNQFQDERSQQIYSLIDLGRTMKMPFEGMTLLDYAINSAVVLSNIALVKHDKPGLLTFSNVPSVIIPASAKRSQMQLILEALHSQNTVYPESDIESLYEIVRRTIKQRSLIMLYTNFETLSSMNRWRKHLNAIAKSHLLLVVFFKNTELFGILSSKSQKVSDIYAKVMAEKLVFEKRNIVKELNKQGILTILSEPQELTVNALNKYLEIKSRRLL